MNEVRGSPIIMLGLGCIEHFNMLQDRSVLPRNFITGDNVPGALKQWGHLRKKWGHCGENDETSDLGVKNQFSISLYH